MERVNEMVNKIVVMGDSFNPPTIAHLELMKAAIEAVGACQGEIYPASGACTAVAGNRG